MIARPATEADADAIARIYSAGIAERIATFETEPRTEVDVLRWFQNMLPKVVVTMDDDVVAFAVAFPYSDRCVYQGIAEFSVYVDPMHRGIGAGRRAMEALLRACEAYGLHKLTSRIFADNQPSLRLMKSLGFREIGLQLKHGRLDGVWRDVMTVEILLEGNL